jgi:membrane carboxypeptidase/penicillin-binding protein PbpC
VAVKTGTSNSLRDNLAIGYNQYFLVATWVGNNDNSPMARVASGVTGATPIFNKIMTNLLKDKSNHTWEVPDGIKKISVCYSSKKSDSEEVVTRKFEEWFLLENIPKNSCTQTKSENS